MSAGGFWGDDSEAAGRPGAVTSSGDEVRRALDELVRTRPEVAEDPERLNGYLRDLCPHRTAETAVVVVAARAGVREELSGVTAGAAVEALSARLAARLHTEFGVDEGLARWVVDSWASALGVIEAPPPRPARDRDVASRPAPVGPPAHDEALRAMAARVGPVPPDDVPGGPGTTAPPPAPLVDGPTRSPSAVEAAARTVHRKPAPVAVPPPPADTGTPWRTRALLGGGGLAACLALVTVLIVTRDGGDAPDPRPDSVRVSTTAPAVPSTPTVTAAPIPFPAAAATPTAIVPGRYTTTKLRPGLTVTVPDGWLLRAEHEDFLEMVGADGEGRSVSVLRPTRPLRPANAFSTGAALQAPNAVETAPDDYVAWLRSHSRLSVSEPTPVSRRGFRGTQLDVTVRSPYRADYCGRPCVSLFQLDEGLVFTLLPGNQNRIYAFTVGGSQVLIVVEAPADGFPAFAERADRLVENMSFTT